MYELLILLLDDKYGIKDEAWNFLKQLTNKKDLNLQYLVNSVRCTEGRCYLPEGWNK
jgi:hypothetical protein